MTKTQGLLLICTGPGGPKCEKDIAVPFGLSLEELTNYIKNHGLERWFLSVLTPPGQGEKVPLIFGCICESCAREVMPEIVSKVLGE